MSGPRVSDGLVKSFALCLRGPVDKPGRLDTGRIVQEKSISSLEASVVSDDATSLAGKKHLLGPQKCSLQANDVVERMDAGCCKSCLYTGPWIDP